MEPGADFVGSFATEAFDAYISRNPQPMPDVISIVISDSRETISMSPSPSRSLERSEASSLSAMEILGRNGIFGKSSFYSQPLVKYSKILDLVGGWPTPLKNISQLGWLFPIYGKIKFMFQTTNQWMIFSWLKLVKNPPNPFWDQPAIISGPLVSPCLGCLGDFHQHQLSPHPSKKTIINIV